MEKHAPSPEALPLSGEDGLHAQFSITRQDIQSSKPKYFIEKVKRVSYFARDETNTTADV